MTESEFAQWLTTEIKVAAIPVSAFYARDASPGSCAFALQSMMILCAMRWIGWRAYDAKKVADVPSSSLRS